MEIETPQFTNWVFPNAATLQADFDEYKKKETSKWQSRAQAMGFRFPIFDTFQDFASALRSAPVITLTKEHDRRVMNRSHTSSIENLKSLVSGYNMPRDVDRIVQGYESNAAMPHPIILKGSKGEWIMAGNTRLDTAFIMGITPKVLYVDVSTDSAQLTDSVSGNYIYGNVKYYISGAPGRYTIKSTGNNRIILTDIKTYEEAKAWVDATGWPKEKVSKVY